MKTTQFIAQNAEAALAKVHEQLGPEAVVLSVKSLPASGMGRLWHKTGRIEVLAGLPEPQALENSGSESFLPDDTNQAGGQPLARWRSVAWLEAMGLLRIHADRLQSVLDSLYGNTPPVSLEGEWHSVNKVLNQFWHTPPPESRAHAGPHVFIGPPGCGKTTALCKWLTLAVLTEERAARVWRLDGGSANTSEFLAIHCEMLGVPVERFWSSPQPGGELLLVDLPGVDAADPHALADLRVRLESLPQPQIHLVLNAAYETRTLLAQWEAFMTLNPADLIFTHLDEELGRVKLWNFVFGTNCSIRFLSAGQKIPGEFRQASPEHLFPAETPQ